MPPDIIDLDSQATTALAPEALQAMLPLLQGRHWNPHSAHRGGRLAKAALEAARAQVAALLGLDAAGLIFTSGATEANNLALKGVPADGARRRIITFATEHSCVLESVRHLACDGVPITILPVLPDGMPDMAALDAALGPDVALLSAMRVNNEIGTIWPTDMLADLAHRAGALFHSDCAQAFGKLDCAVETADLVSLSAHKMHGPKGIGALWVRPGMQLSPLLDGGGQEAGIRSGTQAPALAAGFGAAAVVARRDMAANRAQVERLRDQALGRLAAVPHRIHGCDASGPNRWPGNLSVHFPGVDSARLLTALPGLALSSGSACSSGAGRPSHVLAALGCAADVVRATIRIGFAATLTPDMLDKAMDQLLAAVRRLNGSPA